MQKNTFEKYIAYLFVPVAISMGMVLLGYSPDHLSAAFVAIMVSIVLIGTIIGVLPTISFIKGFHTGSLSAEHINQSETGDAWLMQISQKNFFGQKTLNQLYSIYCAKVSEQYNTGEIMNDIEDTFNEDVISVYNWRKVVSQIPSIMTSIGILGTFVGLLIGLREINFGTVELALESVSVLLTGVNIAFYTSIAGIILAVLFNLMNSVLQNVLTREMDLFTQSYHRYAIPSVEEQERHRNKKDAQRLVRLIDKMPGQITQGPLAMGQPGEQSSAESILLPQIMEGLDKHEFAFYLQPKYDLNTRKIIGAEALARWNHPSYGLIPPSVFIPVLEKNGFITKLDQYLWEQLMIYLKEELDRGNHPVPIGINVTKTDLFALNVPQVLHDLLEKYQVPPTYLVAELDASTYLSARDFALQAEAQLKQRGICVTIDGFNKSMIGVELANGTAGSMADVVKIDLRTMNRNNYKAELTDVLSYLGNKGLRVEAAGIESPEDMMLLRRNGCTCGQGFYLSEPVAFDVYEKLLGIKGRQA